jgi:putative ABC transport system ATP-binding protein
VAEPALRAVEVGRTYRMGGVEVVALRGATLTVEPGEFVAILGPSGSGKSTLMNLLGCLDRPTSGSLAVDGVDVAGLDDAGLARLRNRTVGFVFQSFQLLPRQRAVDNVALPLVYRGVPRAERLAAASEALQSVGLGHRMDHRPTQLSGGEQQRVAIARALVGQPRLLLADEPTGNLDSRTGAEVLALFERLNAEQGVAVVLVTHDADVAARAHRRIHVRDGEIELDTGRDELPADTVEDARARG